MTRHLEIEEKQERRDLAAQRALDLAAEEHTGSENSREEKLLSGGAAADKQKKNKKQSFFRRFRLVRGSKRKEPAASANLVSAPRAALGSGAGRYVVDENDARDLDVELDDVMGNGDELVLECETQSGDDVEFESTSAAAEDRESQRSVSPTLNRLASAVTRGEEKEEASL